MEIEVDIGF